MALDTHQLCQLSSLASKSILCFYQKLGLGCLCIVPGFKPLGGFSCLKEPTHPSCNNGTATELSWGGADG